MSIIKFKRNEIPKLRSPATILEEIKEDLKKVFRGEKIEFFLKKDTSYNGQSIVSIVVSTVDTGSEFFLVSIRYSPLDFYPVHSTMLREIHPISDFENDTLRNESEFVQYLDDCMNGDDTKNFLAKILSLA